MSDFEGCPASRMSDFVVRRCALGLDFLLCTCPLMRTPAATLHVPTSIALRETPRRFVYFGHVLQAFLFTGSRFLGSASRAGGVFGFLV